MSCINGGNCGKVGGYGALRFDPSLNCKNNTIQANFFPQNQYFYNKDEIDKLLKQINSGNSGLEQKVNTNTSNIANNHSDIQALKLFKQTAKDNFLALDGDIHDPAFAPAYNKDIRALSLFPAGNTFYLGSGASGNFEIGEAAKAGSTIHIGHLSHGDVSIGEDSKGRVFVGLEANHTIIGGKRLELGGFGSGTGLASETNITLTGDNLTIDGKHLTIGGSAQESTIYLGNDVRIVANTASTGKATVEINNAGTWTALNKNLADLLKKLDALP